MDLTTNYLGLKLINPLVPSASPLSLELANVKRMEDSGAAAVVFHSLFEEQIRHEQNEVFEHLIEGTESFAEAQTFFPEPGEFSIGPDDYLERISAAKEAVDIPVIASLNGSSMGNWIQYAKLIELAGADALELNIYWIPTDPDTPAKAVEQVYREIVQAVKSGITIPVAVKLSPFFTNFAGVANQLVKAGADGLVLFNRFYQPDIDLEALEVKPHLLLSTPMAMRLPLRWIALLRGRVNASLAATGGIHRATDIVKMLMAGADVTMLCSALMRNGIPFLRTLESELKKWLELHEYDSVTQLKGSLSQRNCADPSAFERAHYLRAVGTNVAHW